MATESPFWPVARLAMVPPFCRTGALAPPLIRTARAVTPWASEAMLADRMPSLRMAGADAPLLSVRPVASAA